MNGLGLTDYVLLKKNHPTMQVKQVVIL